MEGWELETAAEGKIKKLNLQVLAGYTYSNPICLNPAQTYAKDNGGSLLSFENTRSDSTRFLKYRYKHLFRADIQVGYKNAEMGISVRYNSAMLNMDKAFVDFPLMAFVPGIGEARNLYGSAALVDVRCG